MALPNEANRLIAKNSQFGIRQVGDVGGTVIDGAVAGRVERAEEVQQGGFAGAGLAGKRQALTLLDGKLEAAEDSQLGLSGAIDFSEIFSPNRDVRHCYQLSRAGAIDLVIEAARGCKWSMSTSWR